MLSFTLIVMLSAVNDATGYRSSGTLDSYTVPGFTTEQACVNAANKVQDARIGSEYLSVRIKTICVANDI